MEALWLGLGMVAVAGWEIYEGRSNLLLLGWVWRHICFTRERSPWLFWFCVSLNFLLAFACFLLAALTWEPKGQQP